jgi:head-tail adaptor
MAYPIAQELTEQVVIWNTTMPIRAVGIPTLTTIQATAWARITETSGTIGELDQTDNEQRQGFEVWMRYIPDIKGWMCIVWGSRILQMIDAPTKVVDAQKQQWLRIMCQESTERSIT